MKTHRVARVAEVIREAAAETILFHLQDPRVKNVTVTRAEVTADLQHAKVFVSIMGTPKEQDLCMHGLRHATGFVQSRVAGRLTTRFTPILRFVLDEGVKKSLEVTRVLNEALASLQKPETVTEPQSNGPTDKSPTDQEEESVRDNDPAGS